MESPSTSTGSGISSNNTDSTTNENHSLSLVPIDFKKCEERLNLNYDEKILLLRKALKYMEKINIRFGWPSVEYGGMSQLMKKFKNKILNDVQVVYEVNKLLFPFPDLQFGFHNFLGRELCMRFNSNNSFANEIQMIQNRSSLSQEVHHSNEGATDFSQLENSENKSTEANLSAKLNEPSPSKICLSSSTKCNKKLRKDINRLKKGNLIEQSKLNIELTKSNASVLLQAGKYSIKAEKFLNEVKEHLHDKPCDYYKFLRTILAVRKSDTENITTEEHERIEIDIYFQASNLLQNENLLEKFAGYLPHLNRKKKLLNAEEKQSELNVEPANRNLSALPQTPKEEITAAVKLIAKIRKHLQDRPDDYTTFMDLINMYTAQNESGIMTGASRFTKMDIYFQASKLLDNKDLLQEFAEYIPRLTEDTITSDTALSISSANNRVETKRSKTSQHAAIVKSIIKIRGHFRNRPEAYAKFLNLIAEYKKQNGSPNVIPNTKKYLTEWQIYKTASKLFKDKNMLQEFAQYLPYSKRKRIHNKQSQRHQNNANSSVPSTEIYTDISLSEAKTDI